MIIQHGRVYGMPRPKGMPFAVATDIPLGAIGGAALGALAGPNGVIAGAIMGGIAGLLAAFALTRHARMNAYVQEALDEDIGVMGGTLGAPNLEHPPAKMGLYAAESTGMSSEQSGLADVEGQFPMRDG